MKRQRAFLDGSQNLPPKKAKLQRSNATLTMSTIPRSPSLSALQKRQINRMIQMKEEIKIKDINFVAAGISTTATTLVLSAIPQGVDQGSRISNQIRVIGFKINWQVYCADTTNVVRTIFWTYKSNSQNFAPTGNLVMNYGSSGVSVQPDSQYNWQNRKDYKIHYDKEYDLSINANPMEITQVRVNIPQKYQQVDFITDSGTTGLNHLCLTTVSDSAAASHPYITGTVRLFYQDA